MELGFLFGEKSNCRDMSEKELRFLSNLETIFIIIMIKSIKSFTKKQRGGDTFG
jgi:hypothetical protein